MLRNSKRVAIGLAASAAVAVMLAGCSTSGSTATSSSTAIKNPTVAMVTPESTGEYYGAMYCGARAAAKSTGVKLKIQGTPETTTDAEMTVLQSALATNPDGLILTVWDSSAFNSTLSSYTSAGNPLVMPDSFLSNGKYAQSIRTNNYTSSYDAAEQAVKNFGVKSGKVLIVTDAPGNEVQSARAKGFRAAIEKNTNLSVLKTQYVGSDSAKASQVVTSAVAANSDISLVFSTNIGAGTGVGNGLSTSGSKAVHIGFDAAANQVQDLKKGIYSALIAQDPYKMGYDSVTTMSNILEGKTSVDKIKKKDVWSPWKLVTAKNVDDKDIAKYLYTTKCS